jgi:hypothetical protein
MMDRTLRTSCIITVTAVVAAFLGQVSSISGHA